MSIGSAVRQAGATTNIRWIVVVLSCLVGAVGATGYLEREMFSQPSVTKYFVTLAGPGAVALIAMSRMPLRVLVGLAILLAPLNFVMTFDTLHITPLVVLLIGAIAVAACTVRTEPMGWLGWGSIAAAALLLPAVASSSNVGAYLTWLLETMFMGWLVYVVAREPGGVRFVLMMIVASVAVQGLLAVYEYRSGHQLNLYNSSGVATFGQSYYFSYGTAKRYTGTMPDPIALGNVVALALPLMISLAAMQRRYWARALLAIVAALSSLGLILSLSRMSWIGAVSGIAVCLLLLPGRVRWQTLAGTAVTLGVAISIGLGLGGAPLRTRISSTLNPTNVQSKYATTAKGDQLRPRLWTAALRTAEAKPLTGTGFGNLVPALNQHGVSVPPAAHAQSWYFQLLGEAGFVGGAALLCWILAALRDLWVGYRRFPILAAGAAGSLLAVLITWTTDIEPRYVQVSAIIAALFGLIAAIGARRPLPDTGLTEDRFSPPRFGRTMNQLSAGTEKRAASVGLRERTPYGRPETVEVLIVSFNTTILLEDCLQSIFAHLPRPDVVGVKVAVLDNASTDGSAEMVRRRFAQVRLVESPENIGFARANNRLACEAKADYIMLLNSDTRFTMDVITPLVSALQQDPGLCLAAPRLVFPDGRLQFSSECFPKLRFEVARELWGTKLAAPVSAKLRAILNEHRRSVEIENRVAHRADFVWATCWLMRADEVRDHGLFDEYFVTYDEDLDFCRRLRDRGGGAMYVPSAELVHLGGASSTSEAKRRLAFSARKRYYRRHGGIMTSILYGGMVRLVSQMKTWSAAYRRHSMPRMN